MMNISLSSIMASLLFSVIGMWMFREAKRRANVKLIAIAILLMLYTYFTPNPWFDWGIGIALCGLAKFYWYS